MAGKAKTENETKKVEIKRDSSATRMLRNSPARIEGRPSVNRGRPRSPGRPRKTDSPPWIQRSNSSSRRSPSRRSPARSVKKEFVEKLDKVVKPKKASKATTDTDSDSDVAESEVKEKPKAAVRGRSRVADVDKHIQELRDDSFPTSNFGMIRRSARISQNRDIERVVHLKSFEVTKSKLIELSDEDDIKIVEEEKIPISKVKLVEFGGSFGAAFLIVLIPLASLGFNVLSSDPNFSFKKLPDFRKYLNISLFFDLMSASTFAAFVVLFAMLNALPFGGPKVAGLLNKQGKLLYTMNGLFIAVLLLMALVGLELYQIRAFQFVHEKYLQFAVASTIFGIVTSIYLYVRSFYVRLSALNSHAMSSSGIYNFFIGREINPRLFGILDMKMYFLRYMAVLVLIFNVAFIYKSLGNSITLQNLLEIKSINATLLTICISQIIFALDMLIFKSTFISTFELQFEGLGYMTTLGYCLYPFLVTPISKYVLDNGVKINEFQLSAIVLLFTMGYILARCSDCQKNTFRLNPYNPAVAHLETIPTSQGKKLLVSGYWGFIRHPNYLGHILICLSWANFVLCVPLVLIIAGNIGLLVHRAVRDGARCKEKYGAAWDRYCQRVKYVLIPKVY